MTESDQPVVLVVEDAHDVAGTYEMWLADEYEIRIAHSGAEALSELDDAVDVVLLDRMMPEMSGDEVLEEIRDRGVDCRVAMVTAVDPDFDVIEMGFDDYVTKPPTEEELEDTIEDLLARDSYADRMQEYRALVSTRAALQAQKGEEELAESEEYARLQADIEALSDELDESADRLTDDAEFLSTLRSLAGEGDLEEE